MITSFFNALSGRLAGLPAPALMVLATFLFATMGVCVKLASQWYQAWEIVFYRGLVGMIMLGVLVRLRGGTLRTRIPMAHVWRSASGVAALSMWFYAIGGLPLATAMTLNYTSSVWMAAFLIGGAILLGAQRVDGRLVVSVLAGFAGMAMILRPTIGEDQLWHGLIGLMSGVLSAVAYLQITALGRAGEPEYRIVFYFSAGGALIGALMMWLLGTSTHGGVGLLLLLAVGVLATTAQMMMTRAYSRGSTLVNATLQYLAIVFAFTYGVLLFRDPLSWLALGGMVLIVGSGILASLLRQQVAPPTPRDPPPFTESTS